MYIYETFNETKIMDTLRHYSEHYCMVNLHVYVIKMTEVEYFRRPAINTT